MRVGVVSSVYLDSLAVNPRYNHLNSTTDYIVAVMIM